MKRKLLMGIGSLLLASSSMFAGWGVSVGVGSGYGYYRPHRPVYVAPPYRYYSPYYVRPYVAAVPPVYAAPAPYGYVAPPPFFGAVWIAPHWSYGPYGRRWMGGYWGHRR